MIPLSVAKAPSSCNGNIEFDEPIADESVRGALVAEPAARHAARVRVSSEGNRRINDGRAEGNRAR